MKYHRCGTLPLPSLSVVRASCLRRSSLAMLAAILLTAAISVQVAAQTTEDFSTAAPPGWLLTAGAQSKDGVLSCSGTGHGLWIATFPADFRLSLRYRQGEGLGQIAFHGTGELPKDTDYRLRLHPQGVQLARAVEGQEQVLLTQPTPIAVGVWHDVIVEMVGGQITLTINGKKVSSVTDPQPLPNGIMGFGAINTTGVAFDDIAVAPAGAGTVSMPTTGTTTVQAGTTPGEFAAEVVSRAKVTSVLDLLPKMQTAASRRALSQQLGTSSEALFIVAQEAELYRIVGAQNMTPKEMGMLQWLDLERAEDLARYRGRESVLREQLAEVAAAAGIEAPSLARVTDWVNAAQNGKTNLPKPDAPAPRAAPQPARMLHLNERDALPGPTGMMKAQVEKAIKRQAATAPSPAPGTAVVTGVVEIGKMLAPENVLIRPGEELVREFEARVPGLYRIDFHLERKGGAATLAWRIEKPEVTPTPWSQAQAGGTVGYIPGGSVAYTIAGWTPIIEGGKPFQTDVPGAPNCLAFFWVKREHITVAGRLRLRLAVITNEDFKPAKVDSIETAAVPPAGPKDPTVFGTMTIVPVAPKPAVWGRSEEAWFIPPPPQFRPTFSPLQVLEMGRYQSPPGGANAWGITVTLDPDPNTWAPYMVDPKTGAPTIMSHGQYFGG